MTSRSGTLALRRAVVVVCRRLYERGLIAGLDGNVSVRLGPDRVLVTPSSMSKVDVRPADLVEVALDGTRRTSRGARSYREASSEVYLHLRMYSRRPDVTAVVHAHPPVATGFAVVGETLPPRVLPELTAEQVAALVAARAVKADVQSRSTARTSRRGKA